MPEYLELKKSNCKNCYKCIRHCPVKSIRFSGDQAHIIADECILCGQCFRVCPQGAKSIHSDIEKAGVILSRGGNVAASIAPSFVAEYPGSTIETMTQALTQLGFKIVEETAVGATIVKKQYERLIEKGNMDVIISSCCPTVNMLIQKHFPEALSALAPVMTPAQAHAKDIKGRYKDAKVIFIGPCISKKAEADMYEGFDDCVLTFEELSQMLEKKNIRIGRVKPGKEETGRARTFPAPGGILRCMDMPDGFDYISVDGPQHCIDAIKNVISGKLNKVFIEMSACVGSCVGGPVMSGDRDSLITDAIAVNRYAGKKDFDVNLSELSGSFIKRDPISYENKIPSEEEITQILAKMGKFTKEQELNCGTCGYETCREKAVAIYQNKADLTMCLPFLKERAESMSDNIIDNTPNGIIVVNELFEVQRINEAAQLMLNISKTSDVLGGPLTRVMDPSAFMSVMDGGKDMSKKKTYLAEYDKYVEQTIVRDESSHQLICIIRDITDEQREKKHKENLNQKTIEVTDKVIEKQMRAVQEIASLLGETTAEMKVALIKLKETMTDE